MLRFIIVLGAAVIATGAATLLVDAALLVSNSMPQPDPVIYAQAIFRALFAIGLLLLAIFGVLVVILIPEKRRIDNPY